MLRRRFALTAFSSLAAPTVVGAQETLKSAKAGYRLVTLSRDLEQPWSIAFLPDGRMLISERPGRLRVFANGKLERTPLACVPKVHASGQGGLLDICLHPGFAQNRVLYLSYISDGPGGPVTMAARAELGDGGLRNSRRFSRPHRAAGATSISTRAASRSIPRPAGSGRSSMGPKGGDELNILKAGANYCWPLVTYGVNYDGSKITDTRSLPGMEDGLRTWVPSISPCGLCFYTGDRFPGWKGSLFTGALSAYALFRIELDGERYRSEERLLEGRLPYIRDVRQGPDGMLYLVTHSDDGGLFRLEPA